MPALTKLRHQLHQLAELAGQEQRTAEALSDFLARFGPDQLLTGIGGHGLAAVFGRPDAEPGLLVRAELDALPIAETVALPHASARPGVAHKCGHDGHMAMVAGLAPDLAARPPVAGRVILLFQPAEERGVGALRVLADPAFVALRPAQVLAAHNLPGLPLGQVVVADGVFAAASRGLIVSLSGATAHAAEPERGRSPALAAAALIQALSAAPQFHIALHEAAQVTIVHARLGEEAAFGTSPGQAVIMATLRAFDDAVMDRLAHHCGELARGIGEAHGLRVGVEWTEEFPITRNDPALTETVARAAAVRGLDLVRRRIPFAWSEDFGHFCARYRGILFGLGAGEGHPALHSPDYDFPDELLSLGVGLFRTVLDALASGDPQGAADA